MHLYLFQVTFSCIWGLLLLVLHSGISWWARGWMIRGTKVLAWVHYMYLFLGGYTTCKASALSAVMYL